MRDNINNYDRIILNNWEFWAFHGVYEEEKEHKQKFRVDITLFLDLNPAAQSDDINDTVDYAKLYQEVKCLVENKSYNLLESLANAIAELVLSRPLVEITQVSVEKCSARCGEDVFSSQVVLKRSRI